MGFGILYSAEGGFFYRFGPNLDGKVDIEGHELDALPEWIESGALEKVF